MSKAIHKQLTGLGFSRYEIACYLSLVAHHPTNGSQISRRSGIARSKIYDVLRSLESRGLVGQVGRGMYVPLPPAELIKRLRLQFENKVSLLSEQINRLTDHADHDHLWLIKGYSQIITKARDMIASSRKEIYVRVFPDEGLQIDQDLERAEKRGVAVRYVSLGSTESNFRVRVIHPEHEKLEDRIGGRSIDLVVDLDEAITGILEGNFEEEYKINWTRNRQFITASRDSLRHDFYHCFFYKIHEQNKPLNKEEKGIYEIIKREA
ncbi:MAG: TrmB family transcriptional regulator [Deltaproteobacteria bacterium]|nr:TrmB family transcriptional regulator [Deltaproteobacteria bacterium]